VIVLAQNGAPTPGAGVAAAGPVGEDRNFIQVVSHAGD
jgi:hypothetical protein